MYFRVYLIGRKFCLRIDHRVFAELFSNEPKVFAYIFGWIATLIKYPICIEDVRRFDYCIGNAYFRFDLVTADNEMPANTQEVYFHYLPCKASQTKSSDRLAWCKTFSRYNYVCRWSAERSRTTWACRHQAKFAIDTVRWRVDTTYAGKTNWWTSVINKPSRFDLSSSRCF